MTTYNLKALLVILMLSGGIFVVFNRVFAGRFMSTKDYWFRALAWLVITATAMLVNSFWILAAIMLIVVSAFRIRDRQPLALYVLIVFCVPPLSAPLPTFGGIGYLLDLNYLRVLNILFLGPVCINLLRTAHERTNNGWTRIIDAWVIGYIVLRLGLMATAFPITMVAREATALTLDIVVPYYAMTRGLRTQQDLREVMAALVLGWLAVAPIATFENLRNWVLYANLPATLGLQEFRMNVLMRGEQLRAFGPGAHPLIMGLFMMAAIGFFPLIGRKLPRLVYGILFVILLAGLYAPVSRGPWLAAAVAMIIYTLMARDAFARIGRALGVGLIAFPIMMASPYWEKIVDHLPFVGTVDAENVTYRQELFTASLAVIQQHPWLGSFTFYSHNAFAKLTQGEDGFVDFVNTYVIVALSNGLIGLSLYVGIFGIVLYAIFQAWQANRRNDELDVMGRSIFATSVGMMVFVATCSPIAGVITLKIIIAGFALAYTRLRAQAPAAKGGTAPLPPSSFGARAWRPA